MPYLINLICSDFVKFVKSLYLFYAFSFDKDDLVGLAEFIFLVFVLESYDNLKF